MFSVRVSYVQTCFNDHNFYKAYVSQLETASPKISSHLETICRSQRSKVPKNEQKLTKIGTTDYFTP